MSDTKNELPQDNQDFGLDNLPENERAETKEILDSLEDSEGESAPDKPDDKPSETPDEDPKEAKAPKGDESKPDENKGDEKKDEDKGGRRDVSLMPAYKHKIAEKQWQQREAELLAQIEESKKSPQSTDDKPDVPKNPETKESDSDIDVEQLADDLGVDKTAVEAIIKAAEQRALKNQKPFELSQEDKQALVELRQFQEQQIVEREDMLFSKDFNEEILPEIKKEYGDDVPESVVNDLKEKLREIAYTEEYAKVPYIEIYKAKGDFRDVIAPKRKSAESGKGGNFQLEGKNIAFEDLSTEQVAQLSDEDFDKYSDYMARREKRGA